MVTGGQIRAGFSAFSSSFSGGTPESTASRVIVEAGCVSMSMLFGGWVIEMQNVLSVLTKRNGCAPAGERSLGLFLAAHASS